MMARTGVRERMAIGDFAAIQTHSSNRGAFQARTCQINPHNYRYMVTSIVVVLCKLRIEKATHVGVKSHQGYLHIHKRIKL